MRIQFLSICLLFSTSCSQRPPEPPSVEFVQEKNWGPQPFEQDWALSDRSSSTDADEWGIWARKSPLCPYCSAVDDERRRCVGNFEDPTGAGRCGETYTTMYRYGPVYSGWRPVLIKRASESGDWLRLPLLSGVNTSANTFIVVSTVDLPQCSAWNTPNGSNSTVVLHEIEPPNAHAEYLGAMWLDLYSEQGSTPAETELLREIHAFRRKPVVEQEESLIYMVDDLRYDLNNHSYDGPGCGLNARIWSGTVTNPEIGKQRLLFEFSAATIREGQKSSVVDYCPACEPIDDKGPNPATGAVSAFDFGYFPIAIQGGSRNGRYADDQYLFGVLGDATLGIGCTVSSHTSEDWSCDETSDFAVVVGKWMAPFCTGWGLPRGLLRHEIRLSDGKARLTHWVRFTESAYNMPWNETPIEKSIEGNLVQVKGGTPQNCGESLGAAISIEKASGEVIEADLPLRIREGGALCY